ncbi:nucleotidyltransferase family protein [Halomonas shantousis]
MIAVVMAAGRARRFGADKRSASLPDGRTLLSATLALARRSFAATHVVLRDDDDPSALGIPSTLEILRAPHADEGLGSSLADAFLTLDAHLPEEVVAAAVMLGDMPWIQPATCQRLRDLACSRRILRPRHAGHPGHPVLFGRAFWKDMALIRGQPGARELLRRHAVACREIHVEDAGIHRDVDLPADLRE